MPVCFGNIVYEVLGCRIQCFRMPVGGNHYIHVQFGRRGYYLPAYRAVGCRSRKEAEVVEKRVVRIECYTAFEAHQVGEHVVVVEHVAAVYPLFFYAGKAEKEVFVPMAPTYAA